MKIRRVTFSAPGQVALEVVDADLEIDSPGEVIVRNRFSLISAGTELACLSGTEPWFPLPRTPGYAAVGEVLELGEAVTKVSRGDLVYTHGPHAEYFKIDTADRYTGTCLRLPSGIRPDLALFTRMASIAITSIRVSRIEVGDNVLITGLGLVGNLAAQLALLQGAEVFAADLSAERRACANECGIAVTIDAGKPNWAQEVRRLAGPRGVTTAIEATGLSPIITDTIPLMSQSGEIILLGTPRAPFETNATEIYSHIHLPGFISIKGALEWRYPTFRNEFVKHSVERNSEIILELIASGRIRVEPLYTHRLRPEDAAKAYVGLRERKDEYIGVAFDWTDVPSSSPGK
jgi:2-desacetyl-2-hydroxyethyl bacteriochlorophyllide A dehydrogenase